MAACEVSRHVLAKCCATYEIKCSEQSEQYSCGFELPYNKLCKRSIIIIANKVVKSSRKDPRPVILNYLNTKIL